MKLGACFGRCGPVTVSAITETRGNVRCPRLSYLSPPVMLTVNGGARHRIRPIGTRSVSLTFGRASPCSEPLIFRALNPPTVSGQFSREFGCYLTYVRAIAISPVITRKFICHVGITVDGCQPDRKTREVNCSRD